MVAEAGAGWVLAPALVKLIHQVDSAFPYRPTTSDGSIGDARHQAESFSDHNPRLYNGTWYVTALDITAAPFVPELVNNLTRDARVKYVIWHGQYYQRIAWSADPVGRWVPYHGTDPHTSHVHVSLLLSSSPDTRPWTVPAEEDEVDQAGVEAAVRKVLGFAPGANLEIPRGQADGNEDFYAALLASQQGLYNIVRSIQADVAALKAQQTA